MSSGRSTEKHINVHIASSPKDPRDAVILKKGSTVDGLQNLHKGAVVSNRCKKFLLFEQLDNMQKLSVYWASPSITRWALLA